MAREDKGVVDAYKEGGQEFVSISEFARRENVYPARIRELIKNNTLFVSQKISNKRYLNWKIENLKFQKYLSDSKYVKHGLKPRNTKEITTNEIETKDTEETSDIKETNITEIVSGHTLLTNFNPEDFKDCAQTYKDHTGKTCYGKDDEGNIILDWTTVDRKITALIRNLELKRKGNELIRINDVTRFLSIVFAKTQGKLSNIPDRYTSRFVAFYQRETGKEVSNETATAIKNMLEVESKNILADLQKEIENSEYSENN